MITTWLQSLRTALTPAAPAPMPAAARHRAPRLAWDPVIVTCTALLLLIGLVMVTSASISVADRQTGNAYFYLERQLISAMLGLVGGAVLMRLPVELWERYGFLLLVIALGALLLVLVPGIGAVVNGSRRWLRVGPLNFQASELARLLLLTWLCGYLVRREDQLRASFMGYIKPFGVLGVAAMLLLLEPDMGAAVVLLATAFLLTVLAGVRLTYCLLPVVVGAGAFALLVLTSDYRMKRVTVFTKPFEHALDSGYQLANSLIAVGRGEWFGVGLGESVQKLFYLPEAHTDFVFAVLAEEFGFAGILVVVTLFMVLSIRALRLARLAMLQGMKFHAYMAAAFGLWIGMQALVNMGVTMGLLPTKGLTLPLLSYGRSSLLVTLAWIGLLLRVNHEVVGVQSAVPRAVPRAGGPRPAPRTGVPA
jgi:cell division protein FtsW